MIHATALSLKRRRLLAAAAAASFFVSPFAQAKDIVVAEPKVVDVANDLTNGLAITNNATIKEIEKRGFALPNMISGRSDLGLLSNKGLSENPAMKPIIESIGAEMAKFKGKPSFLGVGSDYAERMFDVGYLTNPNARFALVGIVNRMDQGYKTGNRCGEIRFIYRLAYSVTDKGTDVNSRLPMTINLIFNAGTPNTSTSCGDLARAWTKVIAETTSATEMINGGPLDPKFFDRARVKDLEINLQMSRVPASGRPDFGGQAYYLLKVYKKNAAGVFQESTLENEIDRPRLLADPALLKELKAWILAHTKEIDAGTLLIPDKFLATSAISISPGGINRSANRMYFGMFQPGELTSVNYSELEIVKSQAGLERRLNDSTCVGCHQTRAIGGFHFTGRDPYGKYPGNSVFIPGSAHFMGDLPRRRAILDDLAAEKSVLDYSRGFSSRPQERRSQKIDETGLTNGWGAHCTLTDDPSFKSWTCGQGLACKALSDKDSGFGICLSASAQEVGDPCEFGRITTTGFGADKYVRTAKRTVTVPGGQCSPQSQDPGTRTGGFLNGSVRMGDCTGLSKEAACGLLPASKPGFNACIDSHNFIYCLSNYSKPVGMRGCDQKNPCRDDYICAESQESTRGVCISPYFLFQFRVDGHPKGQAATVAKKP